jgi:ADP-ribose pyrophosphatase YjhB (NUDIX family)
MLMKDVVGAGDRWIPADEYNAIVRRVPVISTDLLPLHSTGRKVGLIRRDVHGGGQGWCVVGGAILRDEPIEEAVDRHLRATLGPAMRIVPGTLRMGWIAQYFTRPGIGRLHDPRKHAVALTFVGRVEGEPVPIGEANEFRWFDLDRLPDQREFGYGQHLLMPDLIRVARANALLTVPAGAGFETM